MILNGLIIAGIGIVIVLLVAVGVYLIIRTKKRRGYPAQVHDEWISIQRLCANKDTWALAVMNADELLGQALKKMHFKGKSIGERLVAAQRKLSDNDGVWYAHNLAKRLKDESSKRLREADVKKALIGVRQALRDIGAMLNDK